MRVQCLLFVYGTLRQGEPQHALLDEAAHARLDQGQRADDAAHEPSLARELEQIFRLVYLRARLDRDGAVDAGASSCGARSAGMKSRATADAGSIQG